jgi:hypothetical protein
MGLMGIRWPWVLSWEESVVVALFRHAGEPLPAALEDALASWTSWADRCLRQLERSLWQSRAFADSLRSGKPAKFAVTGLSPYLTAKEDE